MIWLGCALEANTETVRQSMADYQRCKGCGDFKVSQKNGAVAYVSIQGCEPIFRVRSEVCRVPRDSRGQHRWHGVARPLWAGGDHPDAKPTWPAAADAGAGPGSTRREGCGNRRFLRQPAELVDEAMPPAVL